MSDKPREFWIADVYEQTVEGYDTYEKALENAWMNSSENVTHVIEKSAFDSVVAELEAVKSELERERLRLAGCGVAALGYFDGCADELKSASLDDVLRMREKLDRLKYENENLKMNNKDLKEHCEILEMKIGALEKANATLRKALQKYANPETHSMDESGFVWSGDYFDYETAQEALAEADKIEKE